MELTRSRSALLDSFLGHSLRVMITSDLDHTMVQNEDKTHARLIAFNKLWLTSLEGQGLLAYSTGRSPELFLKLWGEAPLLTPPVIICSVGSEIFYRDALTGIYRPDRAWQERLDEGGLWDAEKVAALLDSYPELQKQAPSEQRLHKLSYLIKTGSRVEREELVERISAKIKDAEFPAKVIFSGGEDLDILARRAGKGGALEYLLQAVEAVGKWPSHGVLVSGDSGNDIELLQVPGVLGCAVGNAHPELKEWVAAHAGPNTFQASEPCSGAIVEALHHFKCIADPEACKTRASIDLDLASALHDVSVDPGPLVRQGIWDLARKALGITEAQENTFWVDMLSATSSGDGRWNVQFTAHRLGEDGTRDLSAAIVVTALLADVGCKLDTLEYQSVPATSAEPVFK